MLSTVKALETDRHMQLKSMRVVIFVRRLGVTEPSG